MRHDPSIISSAKTPLKALYGASATSQCLFPTSLWPFRTSHEIRGGTSCLCWGIPVPSLPVSQKRREWRFKGLFFSLRLQVRLFVKSLLKSPLCRFKRHTNPSLRFRLALPHPDLTSAGVAMGGKKADNQLARSFRNQSRVYFFSN